MTLPCRGFFFLQLRFTTTLNEILLLYGQPYSADQIRCLYHCLRVSWKDFPLTPFQTAPVIGKIRDHNKHFRVQPFLTYKSCDWSFSFVFNKKHYIFILKVYYLTACHSIYCMFVNAYDVMAASSKFYPVLSTYEEGVVLFPRTWWLFLSDFISQQLK